MTSSPKPPRAAAGNRPDIDRIDAELPQTQCRRCGFNGCRPYAEALHLGQTTINRCPPGGTATIASLAQLLGVAVLALDPECGDTPPRRVARIRIADCIGCTKCIRACPVDAIIGAPRHQHHVIESHCTGCDLCLPPCPTDCIEMVTLARDWDDADAARARRHHQGQQRRQRQPTEPAVTRQDPATQLAEPDEKTRRLAAIRARLAGSAAGPRDAKRP